VDAAILAEAADWLAARDADLARLRQQHGDPPLWARTPGYATLLHIVLEQQVSLSSARAAFERLREATAGEVTPEALLTFDDEQLRALGFSRQKAGYARDLARAVLDGRLDLAALETLDDDVARAALVAQRGLGRWSADIYLLMALGRADVWPATDLALLIAAREIKGLPTRPDTECMELLAEAWRPWRSVAARMLWQAYLASRGRPLV
jgi:DNA-3-methyladenine glycosylase II